MEKVLPKIIRGAIEDVYKTPFRLLGNLGKEQFQKIKKKNIKTLKQYFAHILILNIVFLYYIKNLIFFLGWNFIKFAKPSVVTFQMANHNIEIQIFVRPFFFFFGSNNTKLKVFFAYAAGRVRTCLVIDVFCITPYIY